MYETQHGEVHCMLCGRCIADIDARPDGRLQLSAPGNAGETRIQVRITGGRLHCGRCGGRAFVEWDLMPSARRADLRRAA